MRPGVENSRLLLSKATRVQGADFAGFEGHAGFGPAGPGVHKMLPERVFGRMLVG